MQHPPYVHTYTGVAYAAGPPPRDTLDPTPQGVVVFSWALLCVSSAECQTVAAEARASGRGVRKWRLTESKRDKTTGFIEASLVSAPNTDPVTVGSSTSRAVDAEPMDVRPDPVSTTPASENPSSVKNAPPAGWSTSVPVDRAQRTDVRLDRTTGFLRRSRLIVVVTRSLGWSRDRNLAREDLAWTRI